MNTTVPASSRLDPRRSDAWSDYWRLGQATTFFGGGMDQGYDRQVADFWQEILSALDARARLIVDLGTGNGALPRLFDQLLGPRLPDIRLLGVDYAQIDRHAEGTARVELRGGTDMTATGLDTGSADLVVSQFGIEYAGEQAITECRRLLRPGGRFAAIMHHRDSEVVRQSADMSVLLRLALHELDIPARVRALVTVVAAARTPEARAALRHNAAAEDRRHALNQALATWEKQGVDTESRELVVSLARAFLKPLDSMRAAPASRQMAYLDEQRAQWLAYETRLAHLADVALDDADFDRWKQRFRQAGFSIRRETPLVYGPHEKRIGHALVAQLPPS